MRFSEDPSFVRLQREDFESVLGAPGDHEYHVSGADGYFDYFGAAAGPRGKGYYSFDLGSRHLIALNSEISATTGSSCRKPAALSPTPARPVATSPSGGRPRFYRNLTRFSAVDEWPAVSVTVTLTVNVPLDVYVCEAVAVACGPIIGEPSPKSNL